MDVNNATLNDYKAKERNKWNLAQAKNNSAVVMASDEGFKQMKTEFQGEAMKETVTWLYQLYNELDEEFKDELPK